jgi:hypothetical protein
LIAERMAVFDPRFKIRAAFVAAFAVSAASTASPAAAGPDAGPAADPKLQTLAGSWSASAMRSDWNIGDWGRACGPQPSGGGAPSGPVTVSQAGNELSFKGAGRDFSTAECWEQFPGLSRVSHSAGTRSWKTVCKTAASDPRQATLVTSISASDTRINFDETGQYQFVIKGQNCTASVRRTRTFNLMLREGEAAPEPLAPAAERPAPETPFLEALRKDCRNPGSPQRLEVRPSRKLMRPGETFTFRATVVDAQGCALPIVPTWRAAGSAEGVRVAGPKVEVAEMAPEGELSLHVAVAERATTVFIEVASRERYEALLAERGMNREGESADVAVARIASESLGGRSVVARDEALGRKRLFVALVGGAALLLGVVGFVLVRRGRARARPPIQRASVGQPASSARRPPGAKVCPTCREEYPQEAQFCPLDGNRLVLSSGSNAPAPGGGICPVCGHGYDPGISACPKHQEVLVPASVYAAARAPSAAISRKICPVCGSQFAGESEFCGRCGAALVPIN